MTTLIVVGLTASENVYVKSKLAFCKNPFATNRALYFDTDPSEFVLTLKTYLLPTSFLSIGSSTRVHILFLTSALYTSASASTIELGSYIQESINRTLGL